MTAIHLTAGEREDIAVTGAAIVDLVADFYGLKAINLQGASKKATVSWARHVAIVLTLDFTAASAAMAATLFRLDITSIYYAARRVAAVSKSNARTAADLASIRERITASLPNAARNDQAALERLREERRASPVAVKPADAEAELYGLLKDLRRGLASAMHLDPGRVLGGLKATVDEINNRGRMP